VRYSVSFSPPLESEGSIAIRIYGFAATGRGGDDAWGLGNGCVGSECDDGDAPNDVEVVGASWVTPVVAVP
jgi:hypothetical protein